MHMLRYSHGAERLRMHNFYSNLNNIKTFTPLWLNKCPRLKLSLSVPLLWHVFLMKCPKFTWSACHHFFSFVFCRPSSGNQPKIKRFSTACFYISKHLKSNNNKKTTVNCGLNMNVNTVRAKGAKRILSAEITSKDIERGNILCKKKKKIISKLTSHNGCKNHSEVTTAQEEWNWKWIRREVSQREYREITVDSRESPGVRISVWRLNGVIGSD